MESAAIAEACQGERVPCAVVRVISDSAEAELSPDLAKLFSGGRLSPMQVLAAVLRRPTMLAQFWRLDRDSRQAARNLTAALNQLIPP
jgi:hypothetical protein